jgi:uncharacterized protein (TIGR00369 family)
VTDPKPPEAHADELPLDRLKAMVQVTPQARALGMEIPRIEKGRAWGRVPYRSDLVGDPDTGVIAGGVITTFLDQLCGAAVMSAMTDPNPIATIDLRIDYMRPAEPGRDVQAEAKCTKIGRNVAFVRAVAYEDSPDNPVAHAAAAFMINTSRRAGANLREKTS